MNIEKTYLKGFFSMISVIGICFSPKTSFQKINRFQLLRITHPQTDFFDVLQIFFHVLQVLGNHAPSIRPQRHPDRDARSTAHDAIDGSGERTGLRPVTAALLALHVAQHLIGWKTRIAVRWVSLGRGFHRRGGVIGLDPAGLDIGEMDYINIMCT